MRKAFFLFLIYLLISNNTTSIAQDSLFQANGWRINGGFGVDRAIKTYKNNYEKPQANGLYAQLGVQKFWNIIGVELHARYYKNEKKTYDADAVSSLLSAQNFNTIDQYNSYIQRISMAIGPVVNIPLFNKKLYWQLGVKGGYSYLHGSRRIAESNNVTLLDDKGFPRDNYEPFAMGTSSFGFNISPRFSLAVQGHYNYFFLVNNPVNYFDLSTKAQGNSSYQLSSYGLGLVANLKLGKNKIPDPPVVEKKAIVKDILVSVVDAETGEKLKNARVKLVEEGGFVFRGTTDENGEAVFPDTKQATYKLSTELNKVKSEEKSIIPDDFLTDKNQIRAVLNHNDPRFTLVGYTIDKQTKEKVGGVYVVLKNLVTKEEAQVMSDLQNGEFKLQLDSESSYTVFGRKDKFISEIEKSSTVGLLRSQTLYVKLSLSLEETPVGKVINLKNIYYDYDKSEIKEEASYDLEKLVQYMTDNPSVKIELSSHTDSRGKDDYNLNLSQKRAESVIKFLMTRGVSPNRLFAVGYGETQLKNNCNDNTPCSEEEHQLNRRTEFKVIE